MINEKRCCEKHSVTIPIALDNKISVMANNYAYKIKNDLIVELLELGILKYEEDTEIKNLLLTLINKVELLLDSTY